MAQRAGSRTWVRRSRAWQSTFEEEQQSKYSIDSSGELMLKSSDDVTGFCAMLQLAIS
jgi:hypothetical protein